MTEEESNETNALTWILSNMPFVAMFEGLFLVGMGIIFFMFPEGKPSPTALIPAIIGAGLLVPGYLAYSNENMKKHAMHATAVFALVGTLGGAMVLPDMIAGDFGRATIARLVLLIVCGEYMLLSILSFRAARIKREQEAEN